MMRKRKRCVICNKSKTKFVCGKEGQYHLKPVCNRCLTKIVLEEEGLIEQFNEYNKRCSNRTNFILLCSAFILVLSVLIYCKTFSDFRAVINLFKSGSKIIYVVLFSIINYISGALMSYFTQNKRLWVKIILNLIFTVELTLLGCIAVIRDNIPWNPRANPLVYLVPIMLLGFFIILVLNKRKDINKEKLQYGAIGSMFISMGICIWMALISGFSF